jgi:cation diffusion facilitator family transporter
VQQSGGAAFSAHPHDHIFLGSGHERNERKTWSVIALCGVMMVVEIVGGSMFGSLALVADGLHMSTHAAAMLIAALAYTYARRHADDERFVFGTGKLGDLAGFSSAIVLAMIALFIGYEAVARLWAPVPIHFKEAIPIAILGLIVNVVSAWLLSDEEHGDHGHGHHHGHTHRGHQAHGRRGHDVLDERRERRSLGIGRGGAEHDHDAHHAEHGDAGDHGAHGAAKHGDSGHDHRVHDHAEHDHGGHDHHGVGSHATSRDNSIRSAYVHVLADAVVSLLAIGGLVLARMFGWLWMDPIAGIIGALVIANWSYGLLRDTGGVLLDVCPDSAMREKVRLAIESEGDQVMDLHLWRLGPGHLGAVVAVLTSQPRDVAFYRKRLGQFEALSHVTVEVSRATAGQASG